MRFFLCVVVIFVGSNCYIDGWTVWPVVHFPLYIYFLSICHLPVCDVCLCVSHSEMIPCQTFSLRFYVWYRDIKLNISSHGVHVVWFKRDCLLLLLLCCALVFLYRAPRFFFPCIAFGWLIWCAFVWNQTGVSRFEVENTKMPSHLPDGDQTARECRFHSNGKITCKIELADEFLMTDYLYAHHHT